MGNRFCFLKPCSQSKAYNTVYTIARWAGSLWQTMTIKVPNEIARCDPSRPDFLFFWGGALLFATGAQDPCKRMTSWQPRELLQQPHSEQHRRLCSLSVGLIQPTLCKRCQGKRRGRGELPEKPIGAARSLQTSQSRAYPRICSSNNNNNNRESFPGVDQLDVLARSQRQKQTAAATVRGTGRAIQQGLKIEALLSRGDVVERGTRGARGEFAR